MEDEAPDSHRGSDLAPSARSPSRVPKDKGWAWMCVLGAFIMHILVVGAAAKSFGILFEEFLIRFGSTSSATSWIVALSQCLTLMLGPLANSLAMAFSARWVVFTGGLIMCLGFSVSMFAPSLEYLYFSYGILVGLGSALAYAPSIVTVSQYFEKRRALANGLAIAGSGMGNFMMPPLITVLLAYYGLWGSLLILAGLMLNVCICGALLRPVEFYSHRSHWKRTHTAEAVHCTCPKDTPSGSTDRPRASTSSAEVRDEQHRGPPGTGAPPVSGHVEGGAGGDGGPPVSIGLAVAGRAEDQEFVKSSGEDDEDHVKSEGSVEKATEAGMCVGKSESSGTVKTERTYLSPSNSNIVSKGVDEGYFTATEKSDITSATRASTSDSMFGSSQSLTANHTDQARGSVHATSHCPKCRKCWTTDNTATRKQAKRKTRRFKRPKLDWRLLGNPLFLVYGFAMFFAFCGYPSLFMMMPNHATQLGFNKRNGAFLVSVIGVFDVIGRIFFGWFSDLNLIPKRHGFMGSLLLSGLLMCFVPLIKNYVGLAVLCALIGLFAGSFNSLIAVILTECLGEHRLHSAFGLVTMFMGTAFLVAPPIVGHLEDKTQSWDMSFIFCGVCMIIGGLIIFMEPLARRYVNAQTAERETGGASSPGADKDGDGVQV